MAISNGRREVVGDGLMGCHRIWGQTWCSSEHSFQVLLLLLGLLSTDEAEELAGKRRTTAP